MHDIDNDERIRQSVLSLRWEHKALWEDISKEIGCNTETAASVALSLYGASGEWVSYSRNKNHYRQPRRYQSRIYTYAGVVGAFDQLDANGFINHAKAAQGQMGWQSAAVALPSLNAAIERALNGRPLTLAQPAELVILRNKDGDPVDYKDSVKTKKMRRQLQDINEAISSANISDNLASPLVRIFNRNFKRGGRFYALGGAWQSMKKADRQRIQIDGEDVIEIDYKTLHPAILYAQSNAPMPEDSYAIEGWPRQMVKRALLIIINAPTRASARLAIAWSYDIKDMAEPGSQDALKVADELIDDVAKHHKPISWAFHSDKGAELMSLDADLATTVMHYMLNRGITVLPIHDSFLVQKSKADILEEAMTKAAHEIGLDCMQVERKTN